jgi:iron complex outermembrane receptor protein
MYRFFILTLFCFLQISLQAQINIDTVVINAEKLNSNAPFALTKVNVTAIKNTAPIADIPLLLQQEVGVVAASDAGNGIGYSAIRIRGIDATRINVTINGVPINDAESHQMYWVDMPDIVGSASSVQIHRGVSTISPGSAGFGASINLSTIPNELKKYVIFQTNQSSFSSQKYAVSAGTAKLFDCLQFEGRLSYIKSDGYIDRAASKLKSYYTAAHFQNAKTRLSLIRFGGNEKTYQAWYGVHEDSLKHNRTYNSAGFFVDSLNQNNYYSNQTDNYTQTHTQLAFQHLVSSKLTVNAMGYQTRGDGYYEELVDDAELANYYNVSNRTVDLIRQKHINNNLNGVNVHADYYYKNIKMQVGGNWSQYNNIHNGDVILPKINLMPYYFSKSKVEQQAAFAKLNFTKNNVLFWGELQLRSANYKFKGTNSKQQAFDVDADYRFVNPRIGATYRLSKRANMFVSHSIINKEPNRDDLINRSAAQPERLNDSELGLRLMGAKYNFEAVVYNMVYANQLVMNGRINEVGEYVRTNVESSYRRGFELSGSLAITNKLSLACNATFSRNKIENYVEYVDNYDNGGQVAFKYQLTNISFSPEFTFKNKVEYKLKHGSIAWLQTGVGKQYLDNTSDENKILKPYLINTLQADLRINDWFIVTLSCLNFLNNKYEANGYSYTYVSDLKLNNENFYFPQATRSFSLGMQLAIR